MLCEGATYWGFSITGIFIAGVVMGCMVGFFIAALLVAGKEEPEQSKKIEKVRYI